jgi:hypothetical protein
VLYGVPTFNLGGIVRIHFAAIAVTCAAVASLAACQPQDDAKNPGSTSAPVASPSNTAKGKTASAAVPNFVGMGLQSAQDTAQAAGFYALASHDSSGRDRMQALDRNWKVCTQNTPAGKTVSTDTKLDFGSVRLEETCPTKDQTVPSAAGEAMPDFKGKR